MRDDELTRQQINHAINTATGAGEGFSDLDELGAGPETALPSTRKAPRALKRAKAPNFGPGNRAQVRAKANRPW